MTTTVTTTADVVHEFEVSAECRGCGQAFQAFGTSLGGRAVAQQAFCDTCVAKDKAKKEAEFAPKKGKPPHVKRWEALTPSEYQKYDPAKVRPEAQALRELCESWATDWSPDFRPRWLLLTGRGGLGKTTLAFRALRKACRDGGSIFYARASQFDKWASLQFGAESDGTMKIQRCHEVRWMFIDDLGKGRMTERAEAELYDLIEHRNAHRLPLILTSNLPVKDLPWCSDDRGAAIVGRILDNTKEARL